MNQTVIYVGGFRIAWPVQLSRGLQGLPPEVLARIRRKLVKRHRVPR